MADEDNALTGKDVTVTMSINGVGTFELDGAVTNFEENAQFDDVIRKHLGTNRRDIDKVPTGWDGSITVSAKSPGVEDALDAYIAAREARIPVRITIDVQRIYRSGRVRAYTYNEVQFGADVRSAREDAVEYTITWMSGVARTLL